MVGIQLTVKELESILDALICSDANEKRSKTLAIGENAHMDAIALVCRAITGMSDNNKRD